MAKTSAANTAIQDKDPPKDPEAERSLLGAIMVDGTLLSEVIEPPLQLQPEDFVSEKNRILFSAILKRAPVSDDFNPVVICDQLETDGLIDKVGRIYVSGLAVISASDSAVREYARIIKDKARRRKLIAAANAIENMAYAPEGKNVDEIYDAAQGIIFNLAEENSHTEAGPQPVFPIVHDLVAKIKHDSETGSHLSGTPSGFTELDELISGLQPGSLNIIAARPGVGKTSFAMNIVENISMNPEVHKPALVFSLEMPAQQIVLRMLSTFGRVNMRDLSMGQVNADCWRNIMDKVMLLKDNDSQKGKLYFDDSGDITPLELRSRARKLASENGGLSVIMVDYLQLMKGQTKAESRALEVGEISRTLKLLAKELNIPILALSQLNREVEGRKDHRPMNSDLRESGAIEQDADLIMFLHRESLYKGNDEANTDDGKAVLIVSKNRNGAIKDIELQFQGEYTAFYDKANTAAAQDVPFDA